MITQHTEEDLFDLVPIIYRIKDLDNESPLQVLISIFDEQKSTMSGAIWQMYANWFIETCEEWCVSQIAALLGIDIPEHCPVTQRAVVANTVRYRQYQNTPHALNSAIWDGLLRHVITMPPDTQIGITQNVTTPLNQIGRRVNISKPSTALNTARHLAPAAHYADLRAGRAGSPRTMLFLEFPVNLYPMHNLELYRLNGHCFSFDPSGVESPLYHPPIQHQHFWELPTIESVPQLLSPENLFTKGTDPFTLDIKITHGDSRSTLDIHKVLFDDIDSISSPVDQVTIDLQKGRIAFPKKQCPDSVIANFYQGAVIPLGVSAASTDDKAASESDDWKCGIRSQVQDKNATHDYPCFSSIDEALEYWNKFEAQRPATLYILDSARYSVSKDKCQFNSSICIQAQYQCTPSIEFDAELSLPQNVGLRLKGLVISKPLHLVDSQGRLQLIKCSFNPKHVSIHSKNDAPSIYMNHCVTGPLQIGSDAELSIKNCAILADNRQISIGHHQNGEAIGPNITDIQRCTILGAVHSNTLLRAQNTLFIGPLYVRFGNPSVEYSVLPSRSNIKVENTCIQDTHAIFVSRDYGSPSFLLLDPRSSERILTGSSNDGEIGVGWKLHHRFREKVWQKMIDTYCPVNIDPALHQII